MTWDTVWRPRGLAGLDARRKVFWIDTHCHLQSLTDDVETLVARAVAAGVERLVCVGTDLETSRQAVELATAHDGVWATVGLHPHEATELAHQWDALIDLARHDRVVGVGESGFDFFYLHSPADDQERAFRAHVTLAHETGKTLVIHTRDAWDATFAVLDELGVPPRTVFHCFTGGPQEAERATRTGAFVSYSGIVTFKRADDVRAGTRLVPDDRLLVETDAPYLAPVPQRGRENEPSFVPFVGAVLATARRVPVEAMAALTRANAFAAFWPDEV